MNVSTLYAINTAAGLLDHITDVDVSNNIEEILHSGDGAARAEFSGVLSAAPQVSFTTKGIANCLALMGTEYYAIAAAADLYWQKYLAQGTRAGASSHIKLTINPGIVIPRTLSAEHRGEATMSCDIFAVSSDGSTDPVTVATGQSLAGTPATDEAYTIGSCLLNNADVAALQGISVDFGVTVESFGAKGLPYPQQVSVMTIAPRITVRTFDMDLMNTFGSAGAAISAATNVVFSQIVAGGVVNGTAKTLTVNEGRIAVQAGRASGGEAVAEVMITPTYDGTNAPLVLS